MKKEQLLLYAVTDRAWTGKYTLLEQIEQALAGGVTMLQLREKHLSGADFLREAAEVKKICGRYQVPLIINDNVEAAIQIGADGVHVGASDMPVEEVRRQVDAAFRSEARESAARDSGGAASGGAKTAAQDLCGAAVSEAKIAAQDSGGAVPGGIKTAAQDSGGAVPGRIKTAAQDLCGAASGGRKFIIGATAKTVEQAQKAQAAGADYLGVGAVFPSPTKTDAVRITKQQLKEIADSVTIPCVAIGGITAENMQAIEGSGICGVAVISAVFGAEHITSACRELKERARRVCGEQR